MNAQNFGSTSIITALSERGSEALTAEAMDRADADRMRCNAFCDLNPTAIAEARRSDERRANGRLLSPLDGLPVAVKDNLLAAGMRATWGAELFRDFIPAADEMPVERLRASGAIIIGKTNTPAFSARGYTSNDLWGATRNPLDPALTPGGSSGGMAAAIAAGIASVGLGTDGGGSTRRPAAHCGIVGLKPTIGLIPRGRGFLPLMTDLEVVGPMAANMSLLTALVDVMAGPDIRDPRSLIAEDRRPANGLRIGYFDAFPGHPVQQGIRAALRGAAHCLEAMGHDVTEVRPFFEVDAINPLVGAVTDAGFAALAARHPEFDTLAPDEFRSQAENGRRIGAAGLIETLDAITAFRALCGEWFSTFDVLLIPAVAQQAWPVEKEYPVVIDGTPAGPRGHAIFTGWVNAAGLPGLSLPSGDLCDGLPVGVQLISAHGRDRMLLELGRDYEARA